MSKKVLCFIIFDCVLFLLVIGHFAATWGMYSPGDGDDEIILNSTVIADSVRPVVTEAAEAVAEAVTEAVTTPAVTEFELPSSYRIDDMPVIYQEPELPTGCEITSLTILLNYLGFDVSKTTMAWDYLTKDYQGLVGFDKAFIGSPESYGGYGCYAPVIEEAANKYLAKNAEGYLAEDITGCDLETLYWYVAHDMPVVTWCSMDLISVYHYYAYSDAEGNEVYWYENEHCVVLCGYNKEEGTVTVSDPMYGIMVYSAARFEEIYNELEKQAVIIEKLK